MIKAKTTIPRPTVYVYDTAFDNLINAPYMMIKMLEGIGLYNSWWDEDASEEELDTRRASTLKDCAQI